jgi:hypothetical protein
LQRLRHQLRMRCNANQEDNSHKHGSALNDHPVFPDKDDVS